MSLGGSKPSGNTTTTQKSEPWEPQQAPLKFGLNEAQRLYGSGVGTPGTPGTPSYDHAAYNKALSAWNATGPTVTMARQEGRNQPQYKLSDGRWVDVGTRTGLKPGDAFGTPTGPMPTLEQFAVPGTAGTAPNPLLAPEYFPGQTIADPSPESLLAEGLTTNRALAGSPVMNQAQGYMRDVLGGGYLNNNPWLDATYDKAADQVQGRVNSAFGGAGRFGSGLNQRALGDSLSGLAADVYGGNYQQERNRQQQGLLFAPQMANQDYFDIGQLATVGAAKEGRAQDRINADVQRYNYDSNLPLNALQNYLGLVNGNYGGTTTSTQPYYQNKGAGILGGALTGAGAASALGLGSMNSLPWLSTFGPAGLAGGALLGGLLGGM